MMSGYKEQLSPKEWEGFCAVMLRFHYTAKNFWEVPDKDQGDLGLEFYVIDGTLFQCYYPDSNIGMAEYKKRVQRKINQDLKKLKKNEKEIAALLDDIVADQWVLVIPELKSKDLITYCNRKKKEVVKNGLSYINPNAFQVKIETPASYPDAERFAKSNYGKTVDIPLVEVTDQDKLAWQRGNSVFASNVTRKSNALIGSRSTDFQERVVKKYIQLENFLDRLREDYPDLHALVEDSARAQLEKMRDDSCFRDKLDNHFVREVVANNQDAFSKHSRYMSDSNRQSLSFGYLSKWLAECYMDFRND